MAVLHIIFSKHLQIGMLDFMWKLLQATGAACISPAFFQVLINAYITESGYTCLTML
jgi:hypothetical protein